MSLNVKADFPLLTRRRNQKNFVYLDSAATTLKPWPVIERVGYFLSYETANVHRGAHFLSAEATKAFEKVREQVAQFLAARFSEEIVFTKGTTESINLVADALGRKENFFSLGDEILLSEMEHHANLLPWQRLAKEKDLRLKFIPVTPSGELDLQGLELIGPKTKILAITQVSNTLGTINHLQPWIARAKAVGALTLVDGAQAVSLFPVSVQDLDCDFYVFSAHKLFAPYGVGVLYLKKDLGEQLPPYQLGGSMIEEVFWQESSYQKMPFRFEAGTPNIEGVLGLGSALEFLKGLGWEKIQAHEAGLTRKVLAALSELPGVEILGEASHRAPIFSFNLKGCHAADVAQILDEQNIAVRAGHHCTQPLLRKFGLTGTVRASFSIYNDESHLDSLINGLKKAQELLL